MTRFVVLLLAVSALGYCLTALTADLDRPAAAAPTDAQAARPSRTTQPAVAPTRQEVLPSATLTPRPALLERGDRGRKVRVLQARLRQIGWYAGNVTGRYDRRTTKAVTGFQAKRGLPADGAVDRPTMRRLRAMTRRPTAAELANRVTDRTWTGARLDSRCRTGRALCIDKTSRTIRWVVGGEVRKTMAVRFGSSYTPTREGLFHVGWKSRNHVSKLYDSSMPFAMFFSGGQAVHYSPDFAAVGYNGASHGCVNVRDYKGISWLFDQVNIGDKVVVYWS